MLQLLKNIGIQLHFTIVDHGGTVNLVSASTKLCKFACIAVAGDVDPNEELKIELLVNAENGNAKNAKTTEG